MSSQALDIARQGADKPEQHRITRKVRDAIDAMVWQGLPRDAAAQAVGMRPHSLYKAFRKPPVIRAYLDEIGVLRSSELSRNLHTLIEVRDQDDNPMARVAAVKAMEPQTHSTNVAVSIELKAGYVIDLTDKQPQMLELKANE